MTNPNVTWLLPVRNGMPYIPLTLQSIANQTYKNQRIIVWDNGSTDGTLEELGRWIPAHIPGRIVTRQPLRLGACMAALVSAAETELCAVIHGDDISHPRRLEEQVLFLEENPEVGIVGSQIDLVDENGYPRNDPGWVYRTEDAELRWGTRWHAQFCHPSVMFRRSAVLKAGNYQEAEPFEDLDLAIRLARVTHFANLPDRLLKYRRTRTSSTGQISEFLPLDRGAAIRNTSILFPNIRDARRAMRLWDATHPRQPQAKSGVKDIWQLERAAIMLAYAAGKPGDYFINTQVFQEQHYRLKTRVYERFGLAPLVALKSRVMQTS